MNLRPLIGAVCLIGLLSACEVYQGDAGTAEVTVGGTTYVVEIENWCTYSTAGRCEIDYLRYFVVIDGVKHACSGRSTSTRTEILASCVDVVNRVLASRQAGDGAVAAQTTDTSDTYEVPDDGGT